MGKQMEGSTDPGLTAPAAPEPAPPAENWTPVIGVQGGGDQSPFMNAVGEHSEHLAGLLETVC